MCSIAHHQALLMYWRKNATRAELLAEIDRLNDRITLGVRGIEDCSGLTEDERRIAVDAFYRVGEEGLGGV